MLENVFRKIVAIIYAYPDLNTQAKWIYTTVEIELSYCCLFIVDTLTNRNTIVTR